jgi:hypothetical protein
MWYDDEGLKKSLKPKMMAWHVIKIENGNEAFEQSIIMCNNRGESQTYHKSCVASFSNFFIVR